MQHFILLVPLVVDLLLGSLPLLDEEGGDGSRQAQLRVDLADPRACAMVANIAAPYEHLIIPA